MRDVSNGFKIVRVWYVPLDSGFLGKVCRGPTLAADWGAPEPGAGRRTRDARAPHNDRNSFRTDCRTGVAPPFSYYRMPEPYLNLTIENIITFSYQKNI